MWIGASGDMGLARPFCVSSWSYRSFKFFASSLAGWKFEIFTTRFLTPVSPFDHPTTSLVSFFWLGNMQPCRSHSSTLTNPKLPISPLMPIRNWCFSHRVTIIPFFLLSFRLEKFLFLIPCSNDSVLFRLAKINYCENNQLLNHFPKNFGD